MAGTSSGSAFTTRWQRLWRLRALRGHLQQLRNINGQRRSQPVEQVDRRIKHATFDVADGTAIHSCVDGKVLLADAQFSPSLPKIPSDARTTIHEAQSINLLQSIPSDISDVLYIERKETPVGWIVGRTASLLLTPVCMIVAATCMGQETLIDELKHALDLGQQIQLISPAGYPPATQPPIPSVEAAQLLSRAQDGDISSYEGWWQFEGKNGCSDPDYDNWWKVAIGRMEIGGDGPVFGKGLPQIRLYDSGCDLHDLEARDGSLEAAAICQDDEGGVWSGRLTLMAIPQNRLAVSSPLGNHVFERCETAIAAAQEPSPPAVNPPSALPEPPTSAPIIATAPGIRAVESPAAPPPRPEQQRTTIGTVYRDFCDPGFGNVYDLSGPMDLSLYEPYRNQLWTKYRSDCTSFFALDVAEIVALRDVEALLPPPIGRSLLDTEGAFVLGLWLFFAHASEMNECFGPVENGRSVVHGFPGAALAPLGTRDSLSTIAEGYAGALGLWIEAKRQRRVPPCEIFRTYAEGAMTFRQHNSANFSPSP